jgi:hypothetical protein
MAFSPISIFQPLNYFNELLKLPQMCVWALINEEKKLVFVSYSRNFFFNIGRTIETLNDGSHWASSDKENAKLIIIETINEENDLRVRARYWDEYFKKEGYKSYRKIKPINYRTRIETIKRASDNKLLLAVELISANYRNKLIVGVFDKIEDANKFIETHYKGTILKVVYSDNDLTKDYRKWEQS